VIVGGVVIEEEDGSVKNEKNKKRSKRLNK
jgi:hypothetical protein